MDKQLNTRPITVVPGRARVVIVGGGFGGLNCAKAFKRAPVDVVLIDKRNFHLFQPLLYQVATGGLSPANIAAPLRGLLSRQKNCQVLLGDVTGFDLQRNVVKLQGGEVGFDYLIVAAGSKHSYFGRNDWEECAPGLKTIENATEIRARIFSAFEYAERETDPEDIREWLNFVVVGAGPTGVELAGALAEIAHQSLKHDFRHIDSADATIYLIEAGDRVLGMYPEDLSTKALNQLNRLGVTVKTGHMVTEVHNDHVMLKCGDDVQRLPTHTVLWAAGVQASRLGKALAESTGVALDRAGRVHVESDCSLKNHPEVFVIGDMANFTSPEGKPLPGVAPVAIQQGKYVANLINKRLARQQVPAFKYKDYGSMATIGRSAAVADLGKFKFSGFIAWMMWLFIHLMLIVSFRNRLLVLIQWAWHYLSFDRAARLITSFNICEPRPKLTIEKLPPLKEMILENPAETR